MEKDAFNRSVAGKLRHAKRLLKVNPRATGALIGGAASGGFYNWAAKKQNEAAERGEKDSLTGKKLKKVNRTAATIAGGAAGAFAGGAIGDVKQQAHDFNKWRRQSRSHYRRWQDDFNRSWNSYRGRGAGGDAPPRQRNVATPKTPEWAKGVKTKADAKKAYRNEAMKHHPDRGGDAEKMKKINVEWEDFTNHPNSPFHKLAFILPSFVDALIKEAVSPQWIQNRVQNANVSPERKKAFENANDARAFNMRDSNREAYRAAQTAGGAGTNAGLADWKLKNRQVVNRQTAANAATTSRAVPTPKPLKTQNMRARPAPASAAAPAVTKTMKAPKPAAPVHVPRAAPVHPANGLHLPKGRGLAIAGGLLAAGGLGYAALHHHNAVAAQQQ